MSMTTYVGRVATTGTTAGELLSLLKGRTKAVACGATQVGVAYKFQLTTVSWDTTTWLTCLVDYDEAQPVAASTGATSLKIDGAYVVTLEYFPS